MNKTSPSDIKLICIPCRTEMQPKRVEFFYLGHTFAQELLCCPLCNQVYIPEILAKGRMAEVERELEDK